MADNIVKRIIKMVLDRDSAHKTQSDAEQVAHHIEESWKRMAERVAEILGIAFLTEKLVEFGKKAVEEATRSQAAWAQLKGTVDATGASFADLEPLIRETGEAFQDATIHKSEDFAESLTMMVARTGDVKASLNNMGLVANVAATFFKGNLEPAVELVSKAMNGNVMMLQRMGIHAKDAQDALDILSRRSMGSATREASTFAGQLKQVNNAWDEDLKLLGQAIIGSGGATTAITVLRSAVKTLGEWIDNNKERLQEWVTKGVKFAIDAADVFIRAVDGMAKIVGGGLALAWAAAVKAAEGYVRAFAAIRTIDAYFAAGDRKKRFQEQADSLNEMADGIGRVADEALRLGNERVKGGLKILSEPLFTSDQFTTAPKSPPPLKVNPPEIAGGTISKQVEQAIKQYEEAGKMIAASSAVIGDSFDDITPDFERTLKLLVTLQQEGVSPASVGLSGLSDKLSFLGTFLEPFNKQLSVTAKTLQEDLVVANIQADTSIGVLQARVTQLTADEKALNDAIKAGVTDRKTGTDTFKQLVRDYEAVANALRAAQFALAVEETSKQLNQDLAFAALTGASALDKLKLSQAALLREIQNGIKLGQQETAGFKDKVKQYNDVTEAIKQQTLAMQFQAAAADFLADALGTAMQGGLHEAAVQKAKQNAVEAAEMLVRAGAFALFGDFPQATAALALAGQFAGIALAWGALAATTHGSSSGGSVSVATGGGTVSNPGSGLGSSRASSHDAAARSTQPSAEVSIYLLGPGFHAMNPQVQRVVWGAQQQAQELYGPNAKIRVRSSEGG